jgi:hypothetical protein
MSGNRLCWQSAAGRAAARPELGAQQSYAAPLPFGRGAGAGSLVGAPG